MIALPDARNGGLPKDWWKRKQPVPYKWVYFLQSIFLRKNINREHFSSHGVVLEVLAAVALDLVVAQHKLLWEKG